MPALEAFADVIGLKQAAPGRYSVALLLGLYGAAQSGAQNPFRVVHEIRALEGMGQPSQSKEPIQNRHPPLKGLWHKHYLQDGISSLALNLLKGLRRYGIPSFEEGIKAAEVAGETRYVTGADIARMAADVTNGNYLKLAQKAALSGEWIIFAKHEGMNYYLCLGTHDVTTHEQLRQQIDAICCAEFPFLSIQLTGA